MVHRHRLTLHNQLTLHNKLTMKKLVLFLSLVLCTASTATLWHTSSARAEPAAAECDTIHTRPCTKVAAGRNVTLDITPKPVRHMKELTFTVTIDPCTSLPDTLQLDLSMPGMYMGKNRVTLAKTGECSYTGKGIIVRCMSGRTLWQATLLLPELNNPAFTFNVRD